MGIVSCHLSVSLDGFLAGPGQNLDNPVGAGGFALLRWHWNAAEPGHEADIAPRDELMTRGAAYVMGRNMFGPVRGEWEGDWRGWWGDDPVYHAPVFVLTHYPREPVQMEGGTTFHFVTGGFGAALQLARAAAGDGEVVVTGGAATVRQALDAQALDEMVLDIVPILLGGGERLLDGVNDPGLEPVEVVHSPYATHIRYRIGR